MKKFVWILCLCMLTNCAGSQVNSIQKRWKSVDVNGNNSKKEYYANLFSLHVREMEFKAGKFISYQDGKVQGTGNYKIIKSGKLVEVTDGSRQKMTINIISLTKESMYATLDGFMSPGDTLIFAVSGSEFEKKKIKERQNFAIVKLNDEWNNINLKASEREKVIDSMMVIIKSDISDIDSALMKQLEKALADAKIENFNNGKLDRLKVDKFSRTLYELTSGFDKITFKANSTRKLQSNTAYNELAMQYEALSNEILVMRRNYNEIANKIDRARASNGEKPFDLGFKADEGAEKSPGINFSN